MLLTPVVVLLGFAAFQAALWSHARTEARVVARDTAALIARSGADPDGARSSARAILDADTSLRDVQVAVDAGGAMVVVTVRARAPGILRGTWTDVAVSASVPREGWVP